MSTLTLRLNDELTEKLEKIRVNKMVGTSSGAIKELIEEYEGQRILLLAAQSEISELRKIIIGLHIASDTFKAVLNVIDQRQLDL